MNLKRTKNRYKGIRGAFAFWQMTCNKKA